MRRIWLSFWLVGLIWGSSFMLIRIGVSAINPFHVVFIRVAIAAIGLCTIVIVKRKRIPRDPRTVIALFLIGIGNTAIPFSLISWGEQSVASSLASVLQATAALFGLVVAHFAFDDERITPQKVVGLALGFLGVIVLASRSVQDGEIVTSTLAGQLAIVVASMFYATFTTLSKKVIKSDVEPIVVAAFAMLSASLFESLLIFGGVQMGEVPPIVPVDINTGALVAVLILGFVNTFIAYTMYYNIVKELGVAKATMVTYIVPAVGLILGVVLLSEPLDIPIIIGAGMIFAGIGIVNLRIFQRRKQVTLAPESV